MIAQRIRDFFDVLFGSRRVADLKESLAKQQQLTDYFRARADRLELMLLRPAAPRPERKAVEAPTAVNPFAGTRFGALVKERLDKIKAEEEQERQAKQGTVKGAN